MDVVVPTYLPNVSFFAWLLQREKVKFIDTTHYQKQTYRNRTEIYGANGKLILTIPIIHTKTQAHQKEREVAISYAADWQKQHWKSLYAAYRSSPFFEFYEADFYPFYHEKTTHLLAFNLALIEKIYTLLDFTLDCETVDFDPNIHHRKDTLLYAKNTDPVTQASYTQVFDKKYGFLSNLSIVDALFNLGPNCATYLKNAKFE